MAILPVRRDNANFQSAWSHIDNVMCGLMPNIEGDKLTLWVNDQTGETAVYWDVWNEGELVCLTKHLDNYFGLSNDDPFIMQVFELFTQQAVQAGFPEEHPRVTRHLTWRELLDELKTIPPHQLDMTAWVYVHDDASMTSGEVAITGLSAYDESIPVGDDNHLSINIDD